jgi:hypothetical protein
MVPNILTFSVVYNCCWASPAQSFSGPSPAGFMTTFYCLRFETPSNWRVRSAYLYPPGTGWPGYTPEPEPEPELVYDWRFTANQSVLATSPLRFTTNIIFHLNTCGHSHYVTFSLTRGWACRLQLLLALAILVRARYRAWGARKRKHCFQQFVSCLRISCSENQLSRVVYRPLHSSGWLHLLNYTLIMSHYSSFLES